MFDAPYQKKTWHKALHIFNKYFIKFIISVFFILQDSSFQGSLSMVFSAVVLENILGKCELIFQYFKVKSVFTPYVNSLTNSIFGVRFMKNQIHLSSKWRDSEIEGKKRIFSHNFPVFVWECLICKNLIKILHSLFFPWNFYIILLFAPSHTLP